MIPSNPASGAKRPKIERTEIEILNQEQVKDVLTKLRGRQTFDRIAALGLATGMRGGELCVLRWKDVDLDAGTLRVEQSLEQAAAVFEAAFAPVFGNKNGRHRHGFEVDQWQYGGRHQGLAKRGRFKYLN